ncbi:MAG: YdcF family protein [Oscillospiraceae bacterium]|jgi:uncharacterized SAM-binding protein YcdF (DUF218 family)|nr:YdcF family protein [Oscillospiraceae bacterium]
MAAPVRRASRDGRHKNVKKCKIKRDGSKSPSLWALYGAPVVAVIGTAFRWVPGLSFTAQLLWLGAAALALYGLTALLARRDRWRRPAHAARRVMQGLFLLLLLSFVVVEALIWSGAHSDPDAPADCVLVLGAGLHGETPSATLAARLEAAVDYLRRHPEVPVVVSGGQGPGESIPEAEAMRRYLVRRGVAAERIRKEEASTSTEENIRFSAALLPEGPLRVAVVSNEFHLYRARLLTRRQGWEPVAVSAPTPYLYLKIAYFIREYASLVWMIF